MIVFFKYFNLDFGKIIVPFYVYHVCFSVIIMLYNIIFYYITFIIKLYSFCSQNLAFYALVLQSPLFLLFLFIFRHFTVIYENLFVLSFSWTYSQIAFLLQCISPHACAAAERLRMQAALQTQTAPTVGEALASQHNNNNNRNLNTF